MKVYASSKWGILRFWLYRKIAVYLALCDTSRNFRELENVGLVVKRRPELVQEKAIP